MLDVTLYRLMADKRDSDDSDDIKLSASTLAALQEFYAEHTVMEHEAGCQQDSNSSHVVMPAEDWVTMLYSDSSTVNIGKLVLDYTILP